MKIQLSAEEIKSILLEYCKTSLSYTPAQDKIDVIVDEEKQLYAQFEVELSVAKSRKA